MKTNLVKMVKVLMLATMTLMLANCSKDNGSSSGVTQFQWVNGSCYDTTNRTYTSNTALCQNSLGNSCNGTYYYNQGYGVQTIQCSSTSTNYYSSSYQTGYNMVYNCRGLSLYQLVNTGYQQQYQMITCQ